VTAPDAPLPAPTQQDRREAILALFKWENEVSDEAVKPIAEAIARARHAGAVAERERCARVADAEAKKCGARLGDEWNMCRCTAGIIAAAIRSLAPDTEGKP